MKNIFSLKAPRINPNDDEMLFHGYSLNIGDKIKEGDIIATAETSKATFDIESSVSGTIQKLFFKEGEMIKVGDTIAEIELNEPLKEKITETSNKDFSKQEKKKKVSNLRKKLDERKKEKASSTDIPYKKNHIKNFPNIKHGNNCYIGTNVTLTNVILGDHVWINRDTNIYTNNVENLIKIGSGSYVGPYVWIEGHGGIEIGECVHITGPGTCLYTHSGMKTALRGNYALNPDNKEDYDEHYFHQPIKIGNNVWIGPNCTIFPGTTIRNNVVVLPNTLVKSGTIKSFSLVHPDGQVEKNSSFVKILSGKGTKVPKKL